MSDYLRDRLVAAVGANYAIEAELGRGGMAAVYRARDMRLNRLVAVKVLPPELAFNAGVRSRFLREAQMAAQLAHPNIVPIYDVDERDGLVYFIMAFVNGQSLARLLAEEGPMGPERVRDIVAQVADALDHAHRSGVIHRDIKPDNILIDRASSSGRPLVTDFGIARAAAEEHRLTVTGMAVGTPAYMSPEQALGERDVDGRSDIYSLGVVAYQMIVGETPFKAANTPAMLMKHVSEPPSPVRTRRNDVPPALASAIERALAKKPEERWATAADFRDALRERLDVRLHAAVQRERPPAPHAPAKPQPPSPRPPETRRPDDRDRLRPRSRGYDLPPMPHERPGDKGLSLQQRIARFRRKLAGYAGTVALLAVVNAVTSPWFPWFLFPTFGMLIPLLFDLGGLWGEGVSLKQVFTGSNPPRPSPAAIQGSAEDPDATAPPDVMRGPHGGAIRRAVSSRRVIQDVLGRLAARERQMLPAEIDATADALVARIVSVGTTLHRLDVDANGATLGSLDERIEALKGDAETAESERRLSLLMRQRATLQDLLERRNTLLGQIESAGLALENLRLDLVRFRSAGIASALDDVTSATREARAVSRDIEHMLDAADEVRRM